jgi:Flp pilus assembly protein TadD
MLNDYGYALHRFGDNKGAVKQLKRAAKLAPANSRTWNNLALAQSRLGDYDDAFKSFTRSGGEFYGRLNVAEQLVRAGRFEESIKHYEAARLLNPNSREVLQHLVDNYRRAGRAAEADEVARVLHGRATERPVQARGN